MKVIEMLVDNRNNIASDLAAESKAMADYMEYCDDEQSEKGYSIRTAKRQLQDLTALIADRDAQVKFLDEEIAKLGTELAERQTEVDEANKLRAKEAKEFAEEEKDMQMMIDELSGMEVQLKQQMADLTTPDL